MNFNEYQKEAHTFAVYPLLSIRAEEIDTEFVYPTLGLVGEAGEFAEKIKKIIRNKNGKLDLDDYLSLEKELGDVMWYVAELATVLHSNLEDIAKENINKLSSRKERGVIKSEGDNR